MFLNKSIDVVNALCVICLMYCNVLYPVGCCEDVVHVVVTYFSLIKMMVYV